MINGADRKRVTAEKLVTLPTQEIDARHCRITLGAMVLTVSRLGAQFPPGRARQAFAGRETAAADPEVPRPSPGEEPS